MSTALGLGLGIGYGKNPAGTGGGGGYAGPLTYSEDFDALAGAVGDWVDGPSAAFTASGGTFGQQDGTGDRHAYYTGIGTPTRLYVRTRNTYDVDSLGVPAVVTAGGDRIHAYFNANNLVLVQTVGGSATQLAGGPAFGVISGLTDGDPIYLRLFVDTANSTARAKVWRATDAEPEAWTLTDLAIDAAFGAVYPALYSLSTGSGACVCDEFHADRSPAAWATVYEENFNGANGAALADRSSDSGAAYLPIGVGTTGLQTDGAGHCFVNSTNILAVAHGAARNDRLGRYRVTIREIPRSLIASHTLGYGLFGDSANDTQVRLEGDATGTAWRLALHVFSGSWTSYYEAVTPTLDAVCEIVYETYVEGSQRRHVVTFDGVETHNELGPAIGGVGHTRIVGETAASAATGISFDYCKVELFS